MNWAPKKWIQPSKISSLTQFNQWMIENISKLEKKKKQETDGRTGNLYPAAPRLASCGIGKDIPSCLAPHLEWNQSLNTQTATICNKENLWKSQFQFSFSKISRSENCGSMFSRCEIATRTSITCPGRSATCSGWTRFPRSTQHAAMVFRESLWSKTWARNFHVTGSMILTQHHVHSEML